MSQSNLKQNTDATDDVVLLGTHRAILLNGITRWLRGAMEDKERMARANKRMLATLTQHFEDFPVVDVPPENLTPEQELESAVVAGFLAVLGMLPAIRECEYYFRRYPFKDFPISRSDYLRNCCEMLFDRVCQLGDRMKFSLRAVKNQNPNADFDIGKMVKAYEKAFLRVVKLRNQSHHNSRYTDPDVSQLASVELLDIARSLNLNGADDTDNLWPFVLDSKGLYQRSAKKWVARVKAYEQTAEQFVELTAQIILDSCSFLTGLISEEDKERLKIAQRRELAKP
jgi:hypothetical protein